MAPRIDDFFSALNKKESKSSKGRREQNSLSTFSGSPNAQTDEVMKELISSESPRLQDFQKSSKNSKTNRGQIGDETEDKLKTNWRQNFIKNSKHKETRDKLETKPVTLSETNWRQTGDKSTSFSEHETSIGRKALSFSSLTGIQRQLTLYIYEVCKQTREVITPPLTLEFLSKVCIAKRLSIKKSLQRLEEKAVVARKEFKNGRGGWSRYSLSQITFQEILHCEAKGLLGIHLPHNNIQSDTNRRQTEDKLESEVRTKAETSPLSSSSVNIIKTTTTDLIARESPVRMSDEWQTIDFSVLSDIGFSESHLAQLCKSGVLEPSVVQDSIYHFAFDLKHNGKKTGIKGDILNFFMGIVSKRAYTAPANYINPDVESLNSYLKTKEKEQKQREELESKLQEIEFKAWYEKLSTDEINALTPENIKEGSGIPKQARQTLQNNNLKRHFKENMWPEIRRQLSILVPNWTTHEVVIS